VPGARLRGAPGTTTLHHLLDLIHKRRPISAFERVFPPLAPQRSAALPSRTPTSAFQPGHLLGRLASGIALLLLVIISYPLPSTRDFSVTAVSSVSTAAFAVGLPQSREPAVPMLALDRLAGVKQILLLITEDTAVALQTLTAVGERIDGQAGAVHTFISKTGVIGPLVTEGPSPAFFTFTGEARLAAGSARAVGAHLLVAWLTAGQNAGLHGHLAEVLQLAVDVKVAEAAVEAGAVLPGGLAQGRGHVVLAWHTSYIEGRVKIQSGLL